jgi:hypothetical protein
VQAKDEDPDNDDDEEEEDDDDADEPTQETARFHSRSIAQKAAVNRLRCMPQQPGIVAVWGDDSVVSILNLSKTVTDLSEHEPRRAVKNNKPIQVCRADFAAWYVCILSLVRGRREELKALSAP